MACRKCKNRRFAKNETQQKKLLSAMFGGFCKIRVMDMSTRKKNFYVCTLRQEYLPQPGTIKYRSNTNKVGDSVFNFWALNKNAGTKLDPEAGWVTIHAKEIIFFDSVGLNKVELNDDDEE